MKQTAWMVNTKWILGNMYLPFPATEVIRIPIQQIQRSQISLYPLLKDSSTMKTIHGAVKPNLYVGNVLYFIYIPHIKAIVFLSREVEKCLDGVLLFFQATTKARS